MNSNKKNGNESSDIIKKDKYNREIPKFSVQTNRAIVILVSWISLFLIFATVPNSHYFEKTNYNFLGLTPGIAALWLYIGVLIFLLSTYLYNYEHPMFQNMKQMYLLCFLIIGIVLISRFTYGISTYFSLVPAAIILISIFFNTQVGIITSIMINISCGVLFYDNFAAAIVNLNCCLIAAFIVGKIKKYFELLARMGLILSLFNFAGILLLTLITKSPNSLDPVTISKSLAWGVGSGIGSSILAMGLISYFESLFNIITPFKLLELSDSTKPLLRQLLLQAPGTYHHSILVGNLAEAAASEVGADSLLVRVGAYYHDIGKIRNPGFFIENQMGTVNTHDNLNPETGAEIIMDHVKYGLELAEENNLPAVIQDFIAQHRGDTLVSYFYNKAKLKNNDVDEDLFRYKGIRPKTKEVGIVMLADVVEAAVRSSSNPSSESILNMVHKVIKARIDDNQLLDTPLTLHDLEIIERKFIYILQGLYHIRVEYPGSRVKKINS